MVLKKSNQLWIFILLILLSLKGFSFQPIAVPFSRADSLLADSVLSMAFRNEALYSLQGDLKPISTVHQFYMQLDSITLFPTDSSDFNRFRDLQRIASWLSNEAFCFVVIPWRTTLK